MFCNQRASALSGFLHFQGFPSQQSAQQSKSLSVYRRRANK